MMCVRQAPLPEDWKPCKTEDTEEIYYFNFKTGASTWDHPCDDYYRKQYEGAKKKKKKGNDEKKVLEKKNKEKNFVEELVGRPKKEKKKKSKKALSASGLPQPAGGGSTLDKAPLGSIPSRRGGGDSGLSGLKPLGISKPLGGAGQDRDRDRDVSENKSDDERDSAASSMRSSGGGKMADRIRKQVRASDSESDMGSTARAGRHDDKSKKPPKAHRGKSSGDEDDSDKRRRKKRRAIEEQEEQLLADERKVDERARELESKEQVVAEQESEIRQRQRKTDSVASDLDERDRSLKDRRRQLDREQESIEELVSDMHGKRRRAEQNIEDVQTQLNALEEDQRKAKQALAHEQESVEKTQLELRDLRSRLEAKQNGGAEQRGSSNAAGVAADLRDREHRLKAAQERLREEQQSHAEDTKGLRERLDDALQESRTKQKELASLATENRSLRASRGDLLDDRGSFHGHSPSDSNDGRVERLQRHSDELQSQLQSEIDDRKSVESQLAVQRSAKEAAEADLQAMHRQETERRSELLRLQSDGSELKRANELQKKELEHCTERLKSKLSEAGGNAAGDQWAKEELEATVRRLTSENEAVVERLRTSNAEKQDSAGQCQTLSQVKEELSDNLQRMTDDAADARRASERAQAQRLHVEERLKHAEEDRITVSGRCQRLETQVQALDLKKRALEEEGQHQRETIESLRGSSDSSAAAAQRWEQERQASEIQKLETDAAAAGHAAKQLQQENEELVTRVRTLQQQSENADAKWKQAIREKEDLAIASRRLQMDKDDAAESSNRAAKALYDVEAKSSRLQHEKGSIESKVKLLLAEQANLQAEVASLKDEAEDGRAVLKRKEAEVEHGRSRIRALQSEHDSKSAANGNDGGQEDWAKDEMAAQLKLMQLEKSDAEQKCQRLAAAKVAVETQVQEMQRAIQNTELQAQRAAAEGAEASAIAARAQSEIDALKSDLLQARASSSASPSVSASEVNVDSARLTANIRELQERLRQSQAEQFAASAEVAALKEQRGASEMALQVLINNQREAEQKVLSQPADTQSQSASTFGSAGSTQVHMRALERQVHDAQAMRDKLQVELNSALNELNRLRSEKLDHNRLLHSAQHEKESAQRQLTDMAANLEVAQSRASSAFAEKQAALQQLRTIQFKHAEAVDKQRSADLDKDALEARVKRFQTLLEQQQTAARAMQEEREDIEMSLSSAKSEAEAQKHRLRRTEQTQQERAAAADRRIIELEAQNHALEPKSGQLLQQLATLQAQKLEAEARVRQVVQDKTEAQADVQAATEAKNLAEAQLQLTRTQSATVAKTLADEQARETAAQRSTAEGAAAQLQKVETEKEELSRRVGELVGEVAVAKAESARLVHEQTERRTKECAAAEDSSSDGGVAAAHTVDSPPGRSLHSGKGGEPSRHMAKVRAEQTSLKEAHAHLKQQRQELKASQKQLQSEREEWRSKRSSKGGASDRVAKEMRKSLEVRSAQHNAGIKELERFEAWIRQRERKVKAFAEAAKHLDESMTAANGVLSPLTSDGASPFSEDDSASPHEFEQRMRFELGSDRFHWNSRMPYHSRAPQRRHHPRTHRRHYQTGERTFDDAQQRAFNAGAENAAARVRAAHCWQRLAVRSRAANTHPAAASPLTSRLPMFLVRIEQMIMAQQANPYAQHREPLSSVAGTAW